MQNGSSGEKTWARGLSTCFPDLTENLSRVEHARHDIILVVPSGALEFHHIKFEVTTKLGVCELQAIDTHTFRYM